MKYASITDRLARLGGEKWDLHLKAKALREAGQSIIMLTIGEPDVGTPPELVAAATAAMEAGRLGYCNGRGEPALLDALAARYSRRTGRNIGTNQIIALPGTQTALYAVFMALTDAGDEVLVGDPMYATYEGIIAATGAVTVPVALRPEHGFRMQVADVTARITPRTRVLFLNTPHNPTGAMLTQADIVALGEVARAHDLWIISDEVYEEMIFGDAPFVSPLDFAYLADRVIVTSSISKSHAAPGFRSGWCVGPAEFSARLLPVAETMLFGNQPFIADMTALAVSRPSSVAPGMAARFARRAALVHSLLHGANGLKVHLPQAGMFTVVDIRSSGLTGIEFAQTLLDQDRVAVMPGESFGASLAGWVRLSLTQSDADITEACLRIARLVSRQIGQAA